MKRKLVGSALIGLFVIIIIGVLMNQNEELAGTKGMPELDAISSASVTSPRHFSEEDAYTYVLDDSEFEELREVLSTQQVNRKYIQLEDDFEYFLMLKTNREETLMRVGEKLIRNEQTNDVYELRSGELLAFVESLKDRADAAEIKVEFGDAAHDQFRTALNLSFRIIRAMVEGDEAYIASVSSNNVTVDQDILRFTEPSAEQEFIEKFDFPKIELRGFDTQDERMRIRLGVGEILYTFEYVEGGSEGYLLNWMGVE
ncbi:hypothetical protein ACFO0S_14665 [Chryseomicrobium palamuruense]|uniref:Uncharacterized protein n=1 Tax=Chryseomicrobium palamuruense TaxID=682973 RepID=A0ABV8UYA6_9BACL